MSRDELPIRFRGDEPDLYLEYNHVLVEHLKQRVAGAVVEDIEDAAACAWIEFFRHQPDRDGPWRRWLYEAAKRELRRQDAERRVAPRTLREAIEIGSNDANKPADPRDRLEERLEFIAAMEEMKRLPERMRRVLVASSQAQFQRDVAEMLGMHLSRVNHLLTSAAGAVRELAEKRAQRASANATPRVARLRELEDEPPAWLVEAIGAVPTRGQNAGAGVLAWRRAALAIDDYRREHGWHSKSVGLGPRPTDELPARRAYARAERAVAQLQDAREQQRGPSLDR